MRRTWALVGQQANHFTCDTLFDQHNHHFMCDTLFDQHNHHFTCDTLFDQHNPPYSFAMRIDVPLKSDDDGTSALRQISTRGHAVAPAAASCSGPADCSLAGTREPLPPGPAALRL